MSLNLSPLKSKHPAKTKNKASTKVLVEYLFLDLQVCERCIGTEEVLEEVITTLAPALQLGGYELEYRKIKMETPELAKQYQFESSPTVRVNGRDICFKVQENPCDCCSDISGSIVDCRTFEFKGETYEVPPKEMLAEAIMKAVFGSKDSACCEENEYSLPENLEAFYQGKNEKSGCGCASSCC